MRNISILLILFASTCSIIPAVENISPAVLQGVEGKVFSKFVGNDTESYIFFAEEKRVFISNAWYQLLDGKAHGNNTYSYYLKGWGTLDEGFLAFHIKTVGDLTFIATTLQLNRSSALSAIKHTIQEQKSSEYMEAKSHDSIAMFILSSIPQWSKTFASGVYDDVANTTIKYVLSTGGDGLQVKIDIKGTGAETIDATIEQNTETPPTKTVFVADDGLGGSDLIGFIIDITSENPKMHTLTENFTGGGITEAVINTFIAKLDALSFLEYVPSTTIRGSDQSLVAFNDKIFVRTFGDTTTYNSLEAEFWEFNSENNTLVVKRSESGKNIREGYVLELTSQNGIFSLKNNKSIVVPKYENKYLAINKITDTKGQIFINDSVAKVKSDMKRNTGFIIQNTVGDRAPKASAIQIATSTTENTFHLTTESGKNWGTTGTARALSLQGRVGFVAQEYNGSIYVIGGYTGVTALGSGVPIDYITDSTKIHNTVYRIDNLTGSIDSITIRSALENIEQIGYGGSLAQPIGVKYVSPNPAVSGNDRVLILGMSGPSDAAVNHRVGKFSFVSGSGGSAMAIHDVKAASLNNRYYQAPLVHTAADGSTYYYLISGKQASTDDPIIYRSSVENPADDFTFAQMLNVSTEIKDILHANAFSIFDEMFLVGNSDGGSKEWKSVNDGLNWTVIPFTGATPAIAEVTGGALASTQYGLVMFILGSDGALYHSSDHTQNADPKWVKTDNAFGTDDIYGAQLVAYENYLYLIGGQDTAAGGNENLTIKRIKFSTTL